MIPLIFQFQFIATTFTNGYFMFCASIASIIKHQCDTNKFHLGLPVFGILTEMYIQWQISLGMSQMSLKTRMCQIPIARIQLIICTTILN